MVAKSALLSPAYFAVALFTGGPGLAVHARCVHVGCILTLKRPCKRHARWIYYPLESTRYIEVGFTLSHMRDAKKWLDVSSPRQIAALAAKTLPGAAMTLLNPDPSDAAETEEMVALLGLDCETVCSSIEKFNPPEEFNVITCVSVLEHIPEETAALKKMWQLLSPGGRLILTLPAYADGGIQLIDNDPYGLNVRVDKGYFYQRFYSEELVLGLQQIVGKPEIAEVWGEREQGWFQANLERKRHNAMNPVWREPYDMARNWKRFSSIQELPGEGVYCAVFRKPTA